MQELAGRAGQLIGAVTDAIMSTVEVAAERVELAARVARVQTRMAAFGAVLEVIGEQKKALADRLADADGPAAALLKAQLAALTAQEMAVLEEVGMPEPAARAALVAADGDDARYRRDGKRFVRVAAEANGHSE